MIATSQVFSIAPKIDVYGRDGRTCALADLVEFRAIKGHSMSAADVADMVSDNGWASKPLRRITMAEDSDEEIPESLASQAFELIDQRGRVLKEKYPFTIVAGRPRVKQGFKLQDSPYIALLAVTIAHGWQVPCSVAPEDAFECMVTAAFNRGRVAAAPWLGAAGMGTAERAGRSFKDALAESALRLGLVADPNPTPVRTHARDAGVDVLAGLVWHDERPGNWVFIGQATCGTTDTWDAKLGQPKGATWRGYLRELATPRTFLAVPHHVDDRFMFLLHNADVGVVLDRLRLTLALDEVSPEVSPVIDTVLAAAA